MYSLSRLFRWHHGQYIGAHLRGRAFRPTTQAGSAWCADERRASGRRHLATTDGNGRPRESGSVVVVCCHDRRWRLTSREEDPTWFRQQPPLSHAPSVSWSGENEVESGFWPSSASVGLARNHPRRGMQWLGRRRRHPTASEQRTAHRYCCVRASLLPLSPPILKKCAGCSRKSCSNFMVDEWHQVFISAQGHSCRDQIRLNSSRTPCVVPSTCASAPSADGRPFLLCPLRLSVLDLCCRGGSRQFSGDNVLASNDEREEERKEESRASEGRRQESTGRGRSEPHSQFWIL